MIFTVALILLVIILLKAGFLPVTQAQVQGQTRKRERKDKNVLVPSVCVALILA